MRLIIKGNRAEAEREASERAIPVKVLKELSPNETICEAPAEYWERVSQWFNADVGRQAPYPIGSLLHYSS